MRFITCGIVFYDEIDVLQRLFTSLKSELAEYSTQWIFVLNHEHLEIRSRIKTNIEVLLPNSEIIFIENPMNNIGFSRHMILTQSKNEWIYMTDPDIEVLPGALKTLIQQTGTDNSIVAYGGASIYESENLFLKKTFRLLYFFSNLLPFAFQTQNHTFTKIVDHLPTCHYLVRKSKALLVGGFSNDFARVGEDTDFSHRAFKMGYNFLYVTGSRVLHWNNKSFLNWLVKMFQYGRAQIRVQRKNFHLGLRFYRLMPLFFGVSMITAILLFKSLLLVFVALLIAITLFSRGGLGLTLTFLSYACGEGFETIYQIFELKNVKRLPGLKPN